jgi:hypothetical protein
MQYAELADKSKCIAHNANKVHLWTFYNSHRLQIQSMAQSLARSTDPFMEFCTRMQLSNYLQSNISNLIQNAVCTVDWRRLANELVAGEVSIVFV